MKKLLATILILAMLVPTAGLGAGMDIQLISAPQTESEPVTLDDFKLGIDVTIDGYAVINGVSFEYVDRLGWINYFYAGDSSGAEADFAILHLDILNTTKTTKDYLKSGTVTVIFDDGYEYAGWIRQYDYNVSKVDIIHDGSFGIDPMYTGHYCFGCTLPNAVINSKAPLKMIIKIDDHEITYHIRK